MINGILYLLKGDLCHLYAYRQLQCFVWNDVKNYYVEKHFFPVIGAIEKFTGLKVYYRKKCEVDKAVRELDFSQQVAVCDIGNGDHSVLLNDKCDDWFSAFDPWWYNDPRCGNEDLQFPMRDTSANVKIREDHLLDANLNVEEFQAGMSYQMGKIKKRFVTIISTE